MKVLVDMMKYCEVYEGGYKERSMDGDLLHDFVEMEVSPQQLKDFIDKGIDIKTIQDKN